MLRRLASRAAALLSCAGVAYLAVALGRVRSVAAAGRRCSSFSPPVTVLKPLHGLEPELEENLASFCLQDYPAFQVVFSATDSADPALRIAGRVVERFPRVDAEIVVHPAASVSNPKIANVLNALPHAKHDLITLVDADMRVGSGYLHSVAATFDDPRIGAATCLYGARPAAGTLSALAAMFVNDHFAPSVLVAQAVEPLEYTFGSTMATRRDVLEEIGGLRVLSATIADDYRLGELVAAAGYRVALAPYVVENVLGEATLAALWRRELRWARTIRSVRPLGSTLSVVTYGLPLAFIGWLLRPRSKRRLVLLAAAAVLRLALHRCARDAFAPRAPLTPHLVPLRDALALAVWAASRVGRAVQWKEKTMDVGFPPSTERTV